MMDFAQMRETMVASQLRVSKVTEPRVLAAMRAVPRELFVPESQRALAYVDEDIDLGGRVLMEPLVFGRLLAKSPPRVTDKALVIGVGLGYPAAVIARLTQCVLGLEEPDWLPLAQNALRGLGVRIGVPQVQMVAGPLVAGWPDQAPYDYIFLNGAVSAVPPVLIDQLAEGGVLAGVLLEKGVGRGFIGRKIGGVFGIDPFMDAHVPALPGFASAPAFRF